MEPGTEEHRQYCIVCIISPWAISLTSGLNRGWAYSTPWAYNAISIYKRPIPTCIQELRAEEGGGLIIHHGLTIRTIRYINDSFQYILKNKLERRDIAMGQRMTAVAPTVCP